MEQERQQVGQLGTRSIVIVSSCPSPTTNYTTRTGANSISSKAIIFTACGSSRARGPRVEVDLLEEDVIVYPPVGEAKADRARGGPVEEEGEACRRDAVGEARGRDGQQDWLPFRLRLLVSWRTRDEQGEVFSCTDKLRRPSCATGGETDDIDAVGAPASSAAVRLGIAANGGAAVEDRGNAKEERQEAFRHLQLQRLLQIPELANVDDRGEELAQAQEIERCSKPRPDGAAAAEVSSSSVSDGSSTLDRIFNIRDKIKLIVPEFSSSSRTGTQRQTGVGVATSSGDDDHYVLPVLPQSRILKSESTADLSVIVKPQGLIDPTTGVQHDIAFVDLKNGDEELLEEEQAQTRASSSEDTNRGSAVVLPTRGRGHRSPSTPQLRLLLLEDPPKVIVKQVLSSKYECKVQTPLKVEEFDSWRFEVGSNEPLRLAVFQSLRLLRHRCMERDDVSVMDVSTTTPLVALQFHRLRVDMKAQRGHARRSAWVPTAYRMGYCSGARAAETGFEGYNEEVDVLWESIENKNDEVESAIDFEQWMRDKQMGEKYLAAYGKEYYPTPIIRFRSTRFSEWMPAPLQSVGELRLPFGGFDVEGTSAGTTASASSSALLSKQPFGHVLFDHIRAIHPTRQEGDSARKWLPENGLLGGLTEEELLRKQREDFLLACHDFS
ncbi:unnamed protein product [Amoebophrya sp. A25]|nr:unnamed protein product [Amoebophrya sp. A25]|eukprot:GSA25T00010251001.1